MTTLKVARLSKAKQARVIDELGSLKAQISNLQDAYNQKIAVFKEFGEGVYEGRAYKVTVTDSVRASLDSKIVKGFLTPAQIIEATKISEVTTVVLRAK